MSSVFTQILKQILARNRVNSIPQYEYIFYNLKCNYNKINTVKQFSLFGFSADGHLETLHHQK